MLWKLYQRTDKHSFPRGGYRAEPELSRRGQGNLLNSMKEVEEFCKYNIDVFLNIFSNDQQKSKVYDCIFLDIDSPTIREAYDNIMDMFEILRNNGVEHYHVVYSGAKGFHVYIPLYPIFLKNYGVAVRRWLKDLRIDKYVDMQCIEPNRLSRVVGTINSKSGERCRYVGDETTMCCMEFDLIVNSEKSFDVEAWEVNDLEKIKQFDQSVHISKSMEKKMHGDSVYWEKVSHYPLCMENLMVEAIKGTDLGHLERLELGKFLLHVFNGDVDKVAKIYKMMSDYKASVTNYQLNYILNRKLKMSGCTKLMDGGLCPFPNKETAKAECPYYPSLNVAIRKDRKLRQK